MVMLNRTDMLKRSLDNSIEIDLSLLRNDILSTIDEKYLNLYKNSKNIKNALIQSYNQIKNKEQKIFSPGIFMGNQGKINATILTRYVIEDILKWDFSTAVHKLSYKILYKHHLRSVKQCYDNLYDVLMEAYPNRYLKPYYFKKYKNVWFENGIMKTELVKEAIREFIYTLIKKNKKYKLNTLPKWINYKLFQKKILPYKVNLSYMLSICFNNSPIKAAIFAFPELNLKPHYFSHVPKGYWKGNKGEKNAKLIMNELYERLTDESGLYKFSKNEIVTLFKYKTYHKPLLPYGKNLGGMLQALFENSPSRPLGLIEDPYICTQICETCNKEEKEACLLKTKSATKYST